MAEETKDSSNLLIPAKTNGAGQDSPSTTDNSEGLGFSDSVTDSVSSEEDFIDRIIGKGSKRRTETLVET